MYVWIGMQVQAKSLGLAPGLANTQPSHCAKFANPPLVGQTRRTNAPQLPGRGEGHGYTWNSLMHKTLFISRWCSLHFQLLLEFTHSTLTESGMEAASNLIQQLVSTYTLGCSGNVFYMSLYKLVDTLEFTGESFGPLVPLCMAVQKSDLRPNNTVQEKYKLAKYFICLYPRDILKTLERMC